MLFPSNIFILNFLPVVFLAYFCVRKKDIKLRNAVLLIASVIFYAWGEPKFIFLLFLSVLVNWGLAILIDRQCGRRRKLLLAADVVFNVAVLFVFKYLAFTISSINALLSSDLIIPKIALPLGISFFTFQAMSYVIDIYRKDAKVQKNPFYVALYILFFPQLVAGPIVRYSTIDLEIRSRKETTAEFSKGMCRFVEGLFKKIVFANALALIADEAFAAGDALSTSLAWLGAVAYTLQIYYDFSGYSDMAIGLGLMFGFHFLENFNYPYISKTISEFWHRWHISLSTWFRDYVYIPLGGNRVTKLRGIFNIFVVWMLTGIWHGANTTFIVWGLYYFVFLLFEKLTGFSKKKHSAFSVIYVLAAVMVGWVIFRADTLADGVNYLGAMVGFAKSGVCDATLLLLKENAVILPFAALLCTPVVKLAKEKLARFRLYPPLYATVIVAAFLVCMSYIVKGSYNPFIYFNF